MSALSKGASSPWDYEPSYHAATRYIRSQMDLLDLETVARYPRVEHPAAGNTEEP